MILAESKSKVKLHFQRFEFKYQVPFDVVEGIIPELRKYMDFDPYAEKFSDNSYDVASVYYDSTGFGCYYDKVAGLRTRKKLRVRFYEPTLRPETQVFLEIKKKYDTVVIKDRLTMTFDQCQRLLEKGEWDGLSVSADERETLNEFISLKLRNGMMPQNLVVYRRKPFISKIDPGFRVTIDYNVRTTPVSMITASDSLKSVTPHIAILEVKFNNVLPFWFHQIIQRYNLNQRPFSKYCQSLEVCYPELSKASMVESFNPILHSALTN